MDPEDQSIAAAVADRCGSDPARAAEMVKILLLLSDDEEEPVKESKDATGHEHKGKGEGGGQFTAGGGGGGGGENKPKDRAAANPAAPAAKKKYGKSKAAVRMMMGDKREEAEVELRKLFGKGKSPKLEDLPSLVGAPDDATVIIGYRKIEGKDAVTISVEHPQFTAERYIFKNASGVHMKNDEFWVNKSAQGAGIGSEVFGRQVEQCQEMGIASIRCHAAKENPNNLNKPHNGYYTWPRFGYDVSIEYEHQPEFRDDVHDALRAKFPDAKTLLDVMATSEGRDWWKANGDDVFAMVFDLDPKGRSMRVWDDYQQERSKKKGGT